MTLTSEPGHADTDPEGLSATGSASGDAPAGDGPLGCVPEGSRVFWNGSYDTAEVGPGTHFLGKFRVFPTEG